MIKEYKTYIMYKYFLYNSTAIVIIVVIIERVLEDVLEILETF